MKLTEEIIKNMIQEALNESTILQKPKSFSDWLDITFGNIEGVDEEMLSNLDDLLTDPDPTNVNQGRELADMVGLDPVLVDRYVKQLDPESFKKDRMAVGSQMHTLGGQQTSLDKVAVYFNNLGKIIEKLGIGTRKSGGNIVIAHNLNKIQGAKGSIDVRNSRLASNLHRFTGGDGAYLVAMYNPNFKDDDNAPIGLILKSDSGEGNSAMMAPIYLTNYEDMTKEFGEWWANHVKPVELSGDFKKDSVTIEGAMRELKKYKDISGTFKQKAFLKAPNLLGKVLEEEDRVGIEMSLTEDILKKLIIQTIKEK
jgi:hypothetical protein